MKAYMKLSKRMMVAMLLLGGSTGFAFQKGFSIQAFIKNGSGPINSATAYDYRVVVYKNGTVVWGKDLSSVVTDGVLSKEISGNGSNLASTAMADYSATAVDAIFDGTIGTDTFTASVYVDLDRNGITAADTPFTGIKIMPVPMAMVASTANSVKAGAVDSTALAAGAVTTAKFAAGAVDAAALGAGAVTAAKFSAGAVDTTALGATSVTAAKMAASSVDLASSTVTGILPLANGGSGANITAANGGVVYSNATTMAVSAAGTSGQLLQSNGAAAPTWTSYPGANATIQSSSGTLTVTSAAASTTTVGDNTGAATTAVRAGTGGATLSSTGTTATAVNISTSGVNGGVRIAANGTGTVAVSPSLNVASSGTITGLTTCSVTTTNTASIAVTGCTGIASGGAGWRCACNFNGTSGTASSTTPATATVQFAKPGYSNNTTGAANTVFVSYSATLTANANMTTSCVCMK